MVAEVRPVVGALSTGATIALPSVWAENDILVIHAETEDVTHNPPTGWAQVTGSPLSMTTAPATRHHLWWKRAGSSESNVSHSITGLDHRISYMYAIRGCPTTGDPWDVTATDTDAATDTTASCPGLTTTEVNTCITCHMTTGFDRGTNSSTWHSGWTNSSLQSSSAMVPVNALTERRDNTNNTGSGGTVGMATGFRPAAGVVDATPVTVVDATTKVMHTVAWKSAVPAIDPTLAEGRTENASPYVTQIIAAKAGAKLVMAVLVSGTAVATPTVTGLGLTWSLVGSALTVGSTATKLCWYESTQVGGSDVSGQITITVGTTPTGCSWSIYQLVGMATTGTVVQSPSLSSFTTTQTITFAAAADASNRPIVAAGVIPQNTGNTITPESGWVEGAEVVRSTPNAKLWSAYQPASFDTSTSITEDGDYDIGMFGLEINFVVAVLETFDGDLTSTATLTGGLTADATATGTTTTTAALTGALTADTPVDGNLAATAGLSGTLTADTPVGGDLTATTTLSGSAIRQANGAGDATTTVGLAGTAAREAQASGAFTVTAGLTGAVTADTPAAGTLTATWTPAGTLGVSKDTSGVLDVATALTGAVTAAREGSGDLTATVALSGDLEVLGSEDFAGHATTTTNLTGELAADRDGAGDLAAAATLAGEITADTTVSGNRTVTAALTGTAGRDADTSGTLAVSFAATGALEVTKPLAGDLPTVFTPTGDMSEGDPPVLLDGDLQALWDASGDTVVTRVWSGGLTEAAALTGGLEAVRNHAGDRAVSVALTGALSVGQALSGTLTVTANLGGALADAAEATYTPGEPYLLTTPGPPYVETGVFGWGQGGWGDGPWGGD